MEQQTFYYDNKIVKMFAYATILWGIVGMLVGVLIAAQMVFPVLNFGLEFTTFGRVRPIHTNAIIFAFVGNGIFTAVYYSMQRLLKTRMFSDLLGRIHFWGWQLIIVLAALTLAMGMSISKEYAELEWPVDILIALIWVVFAINMFGTIIKRRVEHIYVSIWFYIASVITVAVLHIVNSIELPISLFKSYPVYAGVQDAVVQWWYGHNAVAFFLTTPYLGLMYYFMPKAAGRPIYSYRLSIIHFWALIFIYIWSGPHHLLYQAMPAWVQSLGVVFSVMLIAPSWGGMVNGLLTLRGAWDKVKESAILKFFVVGVTAYGMSTFEGPMLAIKNVNAISHFTDWTIGHAHIGAMAWNGFLTFGMLFWIIPRMFNTKLYSEKLANIQFWVSTIGILFYAVPLYWAAFTQVLMWKQFTAEGALKYPIFMETVTQILPMYHTRLLGGVLYFAGIFIFLYNIVKTIASGKFTANEQVTAPAREGVQGTRLMGETMHRWLERKAVRFSIAVFVAIIIGGLAQIIPIMLVKSNIPTIASVKPYTPLELQGRDLYVREGCYTCHSQQVRPFRSEVERYGEYSKEGEFVYDHPFLWGSKRTGPDLAREGTPKLFKSNAWHYAHFQSPQKVLTQSTMPAYPWLISHRLDIESTPSKIKAMKTLGVPYPDGYENQAINDLNKQAATIVADLKANGVEVAADREIIAMIAYMQRLGTDILVGAKEAAPVVVKVPELLKDAASIEEGKNVYKKNCLACHGEFGEGKIGPNLADKYFILGGTDDDTYKAIFLGNPKKGMQAWKDLLPALQVQQVWAYTLSLQGTNPANPKAPQGDLFEKK